MPPRSRRPYFVFQAALSPPTTSQPLFPLRASPFVCLSCRNNLPLRSRPFTTSPIPQKKSSASSKSARKTPNVFPPDVSTHIPNSKATLNKDAEIDPYDFTTLDAAIGKAISRLKDALTKTRDAGRVSAQMIEELPVELNIKNPSGQGASAYKEKTRVGDIAPVVPKGGRSMQVFCAEEAHVKPVVAAIQASPHSLTPQAAGSNESNPLLITVPVPPVTAETRLQAKEEAKRCMEKAALEVRNARGEAQKVFRRMELEKMVRQDELRKAHKGMEEVVKKGQDEVKKVGEGAIKALER